MSKVYFVYKLTAYDNKFYIGSSGNPTRRLREHICYAKTEKNGANTNFRNYTVKDFTIEILHECDDKEKALDLEDQHLKAKWGDPLMLNKTRHARWNAETLKGKRQKSISPERREKIRATMKAKTIEHTSRSCIEEISGTIFKSAAEASRYYGLSRCRVSKICNGDIKPHKTLKFRWL